MARAAGLFPCLGKPYSLFAGDPNQAKLMARLPGQIGHSCAVQMCRAADWNLCLVTFTTNVFCQDPLAGCYEPYQCPSPSLTDPGWSNLDSGFILSIIPMRQDLSRPVGTCHAALEKQGAHVRLLFPLKNLQAQGGVSMLHCAGGGKDDVIKVKVLLLSLYWVLTLFFQSIGVFSLTSVCGIPIVGSWSFCEGD